MESSTDTKPAVIEARALTKRYGDRAAVDDLTFTAQGGFVTGFLGPNGAGKSTTMRMLLGLVTPTSGSITVGGRRVRGLAKPAAIVGGMLDARAVDPRRRARDHVLAYASASGAGRRRADEVIDLVGLSSVARQRVGEFSLGMHQRLGIAVALLGDPRSLVLDEPLNGLDPEGIRWMREFMRDFAHGGRTVLFSSHLMSEMELTADHLIVVGRGRLLAEAPLADFVRKHTVQAVIVGATDAGMLTDSLMRAGADVQDLPDSRLRVSGVDAAEVGRLAAAHGIPLHELRTARDSLEDVFLRLTADSTDYGRSVA